MNFEFKKMNIPEVMLVTPKIFEDERGSFMEAYKASDFKKNGIEYNFVQENHSKSKKGVFRGFHYQIEPKAQGKLVRVVKGSLIDYALDIRKGSPTYGKWVSAVLSAENRQLLWIPPGFAHANYSQEEGTELIYKTTNEYSPEHERGILWSDPVLNIELPDKPIINERDASFPLLKDAENNFTF